MAVFDLLQQTESFSSFISVLKARSNPHSGGYSITISSTDNQPSAPKPSLQGLSATLPAAVRSRGTAHQAFTASHSATPNSLTIHKIAASSGWLGHVGHVDHVGHVQALKEPNYTPLCSSGGKQGLSALLIPSMPCCKPHTNPPLQKTMGKGSCALHSCRSLHSCSPHS
jgi:hypothetical protein